MQRLRQFWGGILAALLSVFVAREIVKEDTHRCDNPDHSTIPNRGQWKRCDLCGHARLKGSR